MQVAAVVVLHQVLQHLVQAVQAAVEQELIKIKMEVMVLQTLAVAAGEQQLLAVITLFTLAELVALELL
jgi:hypothetical protein